MHQLSEIYPYDPPPMNSSEFAALTQIPDTFFTIRIKRKNLCICKEKFKNAS